MNIGFGALFDKLHSLTAGPRFVSYSDRIYAADYHQYCVAGWAAAAAQRLIKIPANLVHTDQTYHYDMNGTYSESIVSINQTEREFEDALAKMERGRAAAAVLDYMLHGFLGTDGEENFMAIPIDLNLIKDDILFVPSRLVGQGSKVMYFGDTYLPGGHKFVDLYSTESEFARRKVTMMPMTMQDVSKKLAGVAPEEIICGIDLDHFVELDGMPKLPSRDQIGEGISRVLADMDFVPGVVTIAISSRYIGRHIQNPDDVDFMIRELITQLEKRYGSEWAK